MTFFKQEKMPLTPPVVYFLEKLRAEIVDLSLLEQNAADYVLTQKEPLNPADVYFLTKNNPAGMIPPHLKVKILSNKEIQAIEFVKPFLQNYLEQFDVKPASVM